MNNVVTNNLDVWQTLVAGLFDWPIWCFFIVLVLGRVVNFSDIIKAAVQRFIPLMSETTSPEQESPPKSEDKT